MYVPIWKIIIVFLTWNFEFSHRIVTLIKVWIGPAMQSPLFDYIVKNMATDGDPQHVFFQVIPVTNNFLLLMANIDEILWPLEHLLLSSPETLENIHTGNNMFCSPVYIVWLYTGPNHRVYVYVCILHHFQNLEWQLSSRVKISSVTKNKKACRLSQC